MREFIRTVEKEQVVYEITKKELEQIKRTERNKGRNDIIGYVGFCGQNYKLQLNIAGCVSLCEEIIDFMLGRKNYISNVYEYSFNDYIQKYGDT